MNKWLIYLGIAGVVYLIWEEYNKNKPKEIKIIKK